MNKTELLEFLRDNLKVELSRHMGEYGDSDYFQVCLLLDDKVISTSIEYTRPAVSRWQSSSC